MIDSMRSFINTGLDTLLAAQQAKQIEKAVAIAKEKTPEVKKPVENPAVEIRLSPEAQALMKALEERNQRIAAGLETDDSDQAQAQAQEDAALQRREIQRPAVGVILDRMLQQYGTPEFSAENQEKLDSLFIQLEQELKDFRQTATPKEEPETDAESGYRRAPNISLADIEAATGEQLIFDQDKPVEGPDGLTTMERVKSSVLYAELDRILGGGGVFFGGDQLIAQIPDEVTQSRAMEAKTQLNGILEGGAIDPSKPRQDLTPAQEARIDAIYREISAIQIQAHDRQASARKQAIQNLIGSNTDSRVIDAGNASLGG